MSNLLILIIGGVYFLIGLDLAFSQAKPALGLTFVAYAIANIGLYLAAKGY